MFTRTGLYNALVNRQSGIAHRYHKIHDGASRSMTFFSWVYLLWLNFAYYVLQLRFLGRIPEVDIYESKRLNCRRSESSEHLQKHLGMSVEQYADKLSAYDVISFDVFDTLIFRPLSVPTDVFYLLGNELGIMDFKNLRARAEWDARVKHNAQNGNMEINLADIWNRLQEDVGVPSEKGQKLEIEIESSLCYANPFMLQIWNRLRAAGKKIIIVSDMYLPGETIAHILEKAGYIGAERIYVSNEYHKSKADGTLFKKVREDLYSVNLSIVHVGDNPHSDRDMAGECGFDVIPYQNANRNMLLYRTFDMSPMIGSAYRATVSNHLYSGLQSYSMEYEYGFIYGGLFVLGYCGFIHEYYEKHGIDKLLFLSRDGDILKQAYDYLYPEDSTEYVYWSRKSAAKLEVFYDKHDYFRRFIYHKMNQDYTIEDALHSMELDFLVKELDGWTDIRSSPGLKADDKLTDRTGGLLRRFIEAKWEEVLWNYSDQNASAKAYYQSILSSCNKAVAVDIGWAGSGAMTLRQLVSEKWQIPCEMIGIIAGTNTIHNAEPDASEPFLQSGKLVAYLYSQSHNRDLLKKHDPNKDYNVFWELLLSSPTPQFKGFYRGNRMANGKPIGGVADDIYMPALDITLAFGKYDANLEGIREIQKGIMDFVREYREHFKDFPYMFRISGRDAYAPMIVASSHNEKYLKQIKRRFDLEINVN